MGVSIPSFIARPLYLDKISPTHDREFGNLLSIADNYRKTVVSMDEAADGNYKGIEHVNIRKFLAQP
jgi:uncharacterized protein